MFGGDCFPPPPPPPPLLPPPPPPPAPLPPPPPPPVFFTSRIPRGSFDRPDPSFRKPPRPLPRPLSPDDSSSRAATANPAPTRHASAKLTPSCKLGIKFEPSESLRPRHEHHHRQPTQNPANPSPLPTISQPLFFVDSDGIGSEFGRKPPRCLQSNIQRSHNRGSHLNPNTTAPPIPQGTSGKHAPADQVSTARHPIMCSRTSRTRFAPRKTNTQHVPNAYRTQNDSPASARSEHRGRHSPRNRETRARVGEPAWATKRTASSGRWSSPAAARPSSVQPRSARRPRERA